MTNLKTDYGIDAPAGVRTLAIGSVVVIIASLAAYWIMAPSRLWQAILAAGGILLGLCTLLEAGLMTRWSKSGKLREREHLIDTLELVGNERVLDVGCGRGLLLNGAARRLPEGRAFGIDIWRGTDLSGNNLEATLANSRAENVADRVEVGTADMRDLPFPDGSMDAVVSSLAIHNVPGKEGRTKAIREIARVLKPHGRVALQDIMFVQEYARMLTDLGWKDVKFSAVFPMFPPIRMLTGRKP